MMPLALVGLRPPETSQTTRLGALNERQHPGAGAGRQAGGCLTALKRDGKGLWGVRCLCGETPTSSKGKEERGRAAVTWRT